MATDIVFPKGKEKEFIETAEKLGYDCLVFAYNNEKDIADISIFSTRIKLKTAVLIKSKKKNTKTKADFRISKSTGDDRWLLEKSDIDMMYGFEEVSRKEYMHHRGSGLNQVLCRIAKQKDRIIAIGLDAILNAKGMLRGMLIGRIMQNIKFLRKYKVRTAIASFAENPYKMRAPHDIASFFVSLGMHPKEAKDSLEQV